MRTLVSLSWSVRQDDVMGRWVVLLRCVDNRLYHRGDRQCLLFFLTLQYGQRPLIWCRCHYMYVGGAGALCGWIVFLKTEKPTYDLLNHHKWPSRCLDGFHTSVVFSCLSFVGKLAQGDLRSYLPLTYFGRQFSKAVPPSLGVFGWKAALGDVWTCLRRRWARSRALSGGAVSTMSSKWAEINLQNCTLFCISRAQKGHVDN